MRESIITDYHLDELAESLANDIRDEVERYGGESSDLAWERADSSEHVIYYQKALELCANCRTDEGEAFLDDCGGIPPGKSFSEIACMIAFGELYSRISSKLHEMGVQA